MSTENSQIREHNPESYSPKSKPTILNIAEKFHDKYIVDVINIDNVAFEIIRKPKTIYAGAIGYADEAGKEPFIEYILARMYHYDQNNSEWQNPIDRMLTGRLTPNWDVCISIDYWRGVTEKWGMMFAREVSTAEQPKGVDVYILPETLYVRVLADEYSAAMLGKENCAAWELFGLIKDKFIPAHGYEYNGIGQELEYRGNERTADGRYKLQYAYVPVKRKGV